MKSRIFTDGKNIYVTWFDYVDDRQIVRSEKIEPDTGGYFTFQQIESANDRVRIAAEEQNK